MAEGTKTAEVIEKPEPQADQATSEQAAAWKEYSGSEDQAAAGNQWDGAKEKFVNKTPRNEQGRFAKVRENLERAQKRSTYVHAVLEGAVEPDENTMDADTWAAARNAQIARGSSKITPPEFPEEKTPRPATEGDTAEQELSPEEVKHFEAHDSFMSTVAAKIAVDPEARTARDGFTTALEKGTTPEAMRYLGHCIADTDNAHAVFLALGKNPDAIVMYSHLSPPGMRSAILALSRELTSQNTHAKAAPEPKPKPPEPVGARASSGAFDVNDETLDPNEWARQRNEQLAKRGRR